MKNKYIYEKATINDGAEISALLKEYTLNNKIDFIYAKDNNAIESLAHDSDISLITVGRDIKTKKILGLGAISVNNMLVNNKQTNVAYLSMLRMKKGVFGHIKECYKILEDFCLENNVQYTYTTILKDNKKIQKMLIKKHKDVPQYIKYSDYNVKFFGKNYFSKTKFKLEKCKNCEQLYNFIKDKNKNFSIYITYDMLKKGFLGLTYKDFYILLDGEEILACGVLWNQQKYKQMILKTNLIGYNFIRSIINSFAAFLGLPKFPKANEVINYATLSFVFCKENHLKYFIKELAYNLKKYNFFVYGSKNKIPVYSFLKYESIIYFANWDNIEYKFPPSDIDLECALL